MNAFKGIFQHRFKPPMLPPCIDSSPPPSNFEEPPNVFNTCGKPCALMLYLSKIGLGYCHSVWKMHFQAWDKPFKNNEKCFLVNAFSGEDYCNMYILKISCTPLAFASYKAFWRNKRGVELVSLPHFVNDFF